MSVPAVSASKARAVYVSIWRVWNVSSATLIVSATDEFLSRFRESLVSGGTISLSATGRITSRYDCHTESPIATDASNWVRGIDWMPERITSDMRAPWYTPSANIPAQNSAPWSKSQSCTPRGNSGGTPKYQKNIQTSSGTFLKNSA